MLRMSCFLVRTQKYNEQHTKLQRKGGIFLRSQVPELHVPNFNPDENRFDPDKINSSLLLKKMAMNQCSQYLSAKNILLSGYKDKPIT